MYLPMLASLEEKVNSKISFAIPLPHIMWELSNRSQFYKQRGSLHQELNLTAHLFELFNLRLQDIIRGQSHCRTSINSTTVTTEITLPASVIIFLSFTMPSNHSTLGSYGVFTAHKQCQEHAVMWLYLMKWTAHFTSAIYF